jgi:hypothetical protein
MHVDKAGNMNIVPVGGYSHRNGETEPPTIDGWFWVDTLEPVEEGSELELVKVQADGSWCWAINYEGLLRAKDYPEHRWWGPVIRWGDV